MKYLIALFTSKVVKENSGRIIYIDPVTKNGYKLKGKWAKQYNLLPMRFAVAAFAYLVLYTIWPTIGGFPTELLFGLIVLLGVFIFEARLYTTVLPSFSCYPNYKAPEQTKAENSKQKNMLLLVSYAIFAIVLVLYCVEKQQLPTIIGASIFGLVVLIRSYQIFMDLKKSH